MEQRARTQRTRNTRRLVFGHKIERQSNATASNRGIHATKNFNINEGGAHKVACRKRAQSTACCFQPPRVRHSSEVGGRYAGEKQTVAESTAHTAHVLGKGSDANAAARTVPIRTYRRRPAETEDDRLANGDNNGTPNVGSATHLTR